MLVLFAITSAGPRGRGPLSFNGRGRTARALAWFVALMFSAALQACSGGGPAPGAFQKRGPVPVLVAHAMVKTVPEELHAIGTVQPYSTVSVKAQVGGQVIGAHFREGQEIKKGQLLFTIDPRPFTAALEQAQANLSKDLAQLAQAEADAQRWEYMYKVHAASAAQHDQYRAAAAALKGSVEADRAAVQTAKLNLQYTQIFSPVDGRAGNLNLNVGNIVKADADTAMVVINQIKPIYVEFAVPEKDLPEIREHMQTHPPTVMASPPSQASKSSMGVLSFIDNAVDTATGTIRFKGLFSNQDEWLWPGEFVNVTLTMAQRANTILVPSQAVQTGQSGNYVFVVGPDMTVQIRTVTPGETMDGNTVIERGLKAQETVVTDGQMLLVPGAKVRIKSGLEAGPGMVS